MINNTADNATVWNVAILNTSSRLNDTTYFVLANIVVTNASFRNVTITMVDGLRHYWKINVTNVTGAGIGQISPRYTFNIDTNYFRLRFGSQAKINFTLDQGDINMSGKLHIAASGNITMFDTSGVRRVCGVNDTIIPAVIECR